MVAGRANSIEAGLIGEDLDYDPGAVGAGADTTDFADFGHDSPFQFEWDLENTKSDVLLSSAKTPAGLD